MIHRMYWGLAILIILLIGVTVVMLTYMTNTENEPVVKKYIDTEPIKQMEKTGKRDTASIGTDNSVVEEPTSPTDVAISENKTKYATEVEGYEKAGVEGMYVTHIPRDPDRFAHLPPPLPPSAVPEDCPEHLKFLPEWIDGVYRDVEPDPPEDPLTDEIRMHIENILLEIVREHNPKRPYVEIWDQFIEYEKMYRDYAEYELGYTPESALAANRFDWIYEQTWAFPEFIELSISITKPSVAYGEEDRFGAAYEVAMGNQGTSWNKITLKDGRDFFIKGNSRYEFVYSGVTEDGNKWQNTSGFARIPATMDAPTVHIDVYNTSDEELEALMGWNYTINPLTMQPLEYGSDRDYIYPRMLGMD